MSSDGGRLYRSQRNVVVCNGKILSTNLVEKLTPYSYEFLTPSNRLIRKTLIPYLFEIYDWGNPLPKEERMVFVEWMDIKEFLTVCPYENVKNVVDEALKVLVVK